MTEVDPCRVPLDPKQLGSSTVLSMSSGLEHAKAWVASHKLRTLLTADLALTWKKVSNQNQYINKPRNILLRQVFSQQLISLLQQGK